MSPDYYKSFRTWLYFNYKLYIMNYAFGSAGFTSFFFSRIFEPS